jgi:putative tricarboxylic transport membrane protein
MELFNNLIYGFSISFSLQNLIYCFIGVIIGTAIGVLPGIGPVVTIAMLLPLTYKLPIIPSLIMLSGIYYGAQYGGSTTSILLNIPGESSSVITCIDGYQMARQGRAGPALAIAAIGSLVAGCIGTFLVGLFGPPLAAIALKFSAVEYFSLLLTGLVAASILAHGDMVKALAMVVLGLLLGTVGSDVGTGMQRYNFGLYELSDGIGFSILAVALFAVAEIVKGLESSTKDERHLIPKVPFRKLMPTLQDLKASFPAMLRGTAVGCFFGVLPCPHATMASFTSYMIEKKIAKDPSRFGRGAIEGVAGPESANNAASQTCFIPTLTLGIPNGATMAMLLGALLIAGIPPGPLIMTKHPDLFWGLITSMFIGNVMLVIINLPLVGIWVKMLTVPFRWMFPSILMFVCIGNYTINNSPVDMYLAAGLGILGYVLMKLECEPAPLILGFVLGPIMEENLRRAMLISRGDPTVFFTRPISLVLILLTLSMLILTVVQATSKKSDKAPAASDSE